jgi:dTDP-4-amino-4,6-dideoxygalactose transaminase
MSTPFLPYGRQSISEDDIAAVTAVLRSDFLTQGPEVERFETALREAGGAKHAIAYSHGTAALFGACWAAGVGPGDEIVTSAITFAASANCAAYLGALPVFADVRADTCGIDVASIERAITPRTKVLIPVDFTGQPADLAQVYALAKKHGLLVIEDAAHSLGATYQGESVGVVGMPT